MLEEKTCVEFSRHDLQMIEAALQTQEKILSLQSRAGGNAAKVRLNELKAVLQRVRRHTPDPEAKRCPVSTRFGWFSRALFN